MSLVTIHWQVALAALLAGLLILSFGFWLVFKLRKDEQWKWSRNQLQILVPDLLFCLHFIILFSYSLSNGQLPSGSACDASAFLLLTLAIAKHLGLCGHTWFYCYRIIHLFDPNNQLTLSHIHALILLTLFLSPLLALPIYLTGSVRTFRELYCGTAADHFFGTIPLALCVLTALTLVFVIWSYVDLWRSTRPGREKMMANRILPTNVLDSEGRVSVWYDDVLRDIVIRAAQMVLVHMLTWLGVVINAIEAWSRVDTEGYPLWRDVVASWCVMLGPVWDGVLVIMRCWPGVAAQWARTLPFEPPPRKSPRKTQTSPHQ